MSWCVLCYLESAHPPSRHVGTNLLGDAGDSIRARPKPVRPRSDREIATVTCGNVSVMRCWPLDKRGCTSCWTWTDSNCGLLPNGHVSWPRQLVRPSAKQAIRKRPVRYRCQRNSSSGNGRMMSWAYSIKRLTDSQIAIFSGRIWKRCRFR